jgi:hypothetical protein
MVRWSTPRDSLTLVHQMASDADDSLQFPVGVMASACFFKRCKQRKEVLPPIRKGYRWSGSTFLIGKHIRYRLFQTQWNMSQSHPQATTNVDLPCILVGMCYVLLLASRNALHTHGVLFWAQPICRYQLHAWSRFLFSLLMLLYTFLTVS